jgi:uncharacterized membrane protein
VDWVLAILLFLHVGGAILAFGPLYAFQILGPMARSEPAHLNFAIRFQRRVGNRLTVPLAVFQGITGLLIVWRVGFELLQRGWLLTAIVLYLIALAIAFLVILPTSKRLDELTSTPPPPGASGPPPELVALAKRARMASITNAILILIIVFLMVTKPF